MRTMMTHTNIVKQMREGTVTELDLRPWAR